MNFRSRLLRRCGGFGFPPELLWNPDKSAETTVGHVSPPRPTDRKDEILQRDRQEDSNMDDAIGA